MATADYNTTAVITVDPSELDLLRANILKSQIATYRLLARNLPVSDTLLNSCSYKTQLAALIQTHLPQEEKEEERSNPTAIVLTNVSETNDQNDTSLKFSSATNMYRWLVGSNDSSEDITPTRIRQHPIGLNPLYIQQEREKR
jgi:hypothetical protein